MHKTLLGIYLFITSLAIRKLSGSDKGIADDASFDLSNIALIFIWTVGFVWAVFTLRNRIRVLYDIVVALVLVLCFWFLLISPIAYIPWKSVLATFSILSLFLTLHAFTFKYQEKELYLSMFWCYFYFTFLSLAVYFLFPEIGSLYTWEGVSSNRLSGLARHPNIMGPLSAFFACMALWAFSQQWISTRLFVFSVMLGFLAVILTQSRTSIFAVVFSYVIFWFFKDPKRKALIPVAALASVIFASIFFLESDFFLGLIKRQEGGDLLSGRGYVWDFSMDLIYESPITGYGYNSTFYIFQDHSELLSSFVGGYIFPHSHNMLLQVLLSGGVVALVLVLSIVALVFRRATKYNSPQLMSAISFYCCYIYSEDGGFFQYAEILMVIFMFSVVSSVYVTKNRGCN